MVVVTARVVVVVVAVMVVVLALVVAVCLAGAVVLLPLHASAGRCRYHHTEANESKQPYKLIVVTRKRTCRQSATPPTPTSNPLNKSTIIQLLIPQMLHTSYETMAKQTNLTTHD